MRNTNSSGFSQEMNTLINKQNNLLGKIIKDGNTPGPNPPTKGKQILKLLEEMEGGMAPGPDARNKPSRQNTQKNPKASDTKGNGQKRSNDDVTVSYVKLLDMTVNRKNRGGNESEKDLELTSKAKAGGLFNALQKSSNENIASSLYLRRTTGSRPKVRQAGS